MYQVLFIFLAAVTLVVCVIGMLIMCALFITLVFEIYDRNQVVLERLYKTLIGAVILGSAVYLIGSYYYSDHKPKEPVSQIAFLDNYEIEYPIAQRDGTWVVVYNVCKNRVMWGFKHTVIPRGSTDQICEWVN